MDKVYGTIEKHYGTLPKIMELLFAMENIYYYGKHFGTIVKYSFNSIFFLLGR